MQIKTDKFLNFTLRISQGLEYDLFLISEHPHIFMVRFVCFFFVFDPSNFWDLFKRLSCCLFHL